MGYLQYLILFLFGLAVGSFLNVISLRYQPGQKILDLKIIGGRSRCRTCGVKLKWHELIPLVSFILQKGHCRNCLKPISWQYPLVEVLSGLIFVFIPWRLAGQFSSFSVFSYSLYPVFCILHSRLFNSSSSIHH